MKEMQRKNRRWNRKKEGEEEGPGLMKANSTGCIKNDLITSSSAC